MARTSAARLGARRPRSTALISWVHVFMFVLFVGWGSFFAYALFRFRRSRNPVANYTGVTSTPRTTSRSAWRSSRWSCCSASRSRCGPSASTPARRRARRSSSRSAEQFAWNIHYAGPDGVFGRTDIKMIDVQDESRSGLDRTRSRGEGRRHHGQSAPPAGGQADDRQAAQQGRHPQLRRARVPREAGRRAGPDDPGLVHAQRHHRRDADAVGNPEFLYEIACAQLCGLGHYRMRGFVTVLGADEFQKWMADEQGKLKEQAADPFK